ALTDWLDGLRSEAEGRLLIVGDLNAYRMEDPVQHLVSAGYVDLTATASDDFHYSHVYFGAGGTLDHAFASPRLADQVRSASILNVNAGQPRDLRMEPSWLGSSDHDPVLVDVRFIQSSTSD
ncbi:MAG: nuclease, partial [Xanthomonadales bacterium]|nr:nuclease [Xanthomonadales bacterium]